MIQVRPFTFKGSTGGPKIGKWKKHEKNNVFQPFQQRSNFVWNAIDLADTVLERQQYLEEEM